MFARKVTVITLMLMGAGGQIAVAQGVGGNSPTDTSHVFVPALTVPGSPPVFWIGEVVGSASSHIPVELDTAGPAWHTVFTLYENRTIQPHLNTMVIYELLQVAGDQPWTGWRIELLTPNFMWMDSISYHPELDIRTSSGLIPVSLTSRITNQALDLSFAELAPGTEIKYRIVLAWTGSSPFTGTIEMLQYPTPEPVSLLGFSVLFLFLRGRRMNPPVA